MPYQVLALKYRPQTFDEVVGQRAVVQTLKNSLEGSRIAHAYLFSGVRGVGKTSVARLLAKALNCVNGPTVRPCNVCSSCVEIAASSSLDVLEIDGASNNSVDDVRDLRETVRYAPSRDRYRIFIIDEVHMLSSSAFNALLKTLEEPPPRVVFIFATTEHRKIPVTILSRCQHFEFRKIARREIAAHLGRVCAAEAVSISPHALDLIARLADGSLRDAQSALDQVIAYSGSAVKDEDVRTILGVLDREILLAFMEKIAAKDPAALLELIDRVLETGHDPVLFLNSLMEQARDLLLLKVAADSPKTLELAEEDRAAMAPLAPRFSEEDLLRIMDGVAREEGRIRFSAQPRYLLEALAVRLCHLADLTPLEDLLARFPEEDEPVAPRMPPAADPPRGASAAAPSEPPSPRPVAEPVAAGETPAGGAVPPAPPADPGEVRRQVEAILERVDRERSTLGGFLSHAAFFDLEDSAFVISLPEDKAVFRASIERKEYLSFLRDTIAAVTGRRLEVKIRLARPAPAPEIAAPAAAGEARDSKRKQLLEEAHRSPVVKSFLDLFQGEISDIEEV
ncbi:MAG TPA: DNA polymerase III subunit gamma/tau [Candidatus Polarisedimenticolia bacterium]|jgi:DNA polymerase-3 subunit gamma/tau|nr:DNA polymerase III subunit gamma/tau [Candidatus Polarisedimenticolia bacterium]